jgi:hypothetical protein
MSALLGRQDPMLEAARFSRLLRQAHDAEVADVRKLGDDEYEVVGRGIEPAPAGPIRVTPPPAGEEVAVETAAAVPTGDATARGGIRFRRGSRLPSALPSIPMVGVVKLDEEAPPVERSAKGRKRPKAEASAETEAREPAPRKKASRPRAKKKVEG